MSALTLDQFREELGYNPWHFWQLSNESLAPLTDACNGLVFQYAWQNTNAVGRHEIQAAIDIAEARIEDYLGYSLAPKYFSDTINFNYAEGTDVRNAFVDAMGRWQDVVTRRGRVIAAGVEAFTLLGTGAVAKYCSDGDSIEDSFRLTITIAAGAVSNPAEVAVYFAAADREEGADVSDKWRVQPVRVQISGTQVTVRGPLWLIAKPLTYNRPQQTTLDPSSDVFVGQLEIYRRYTNTAGTTQDTAHVLMTWETLPYPNWCGMSAANSADPAAVAYAIGRATLRNARIGALGIGEAVYDAATAQWVAARIASNWRLPERITIRYQAGEPLDSNGWLERKWRTVIARMAAAELAKPICACEQANAELRRWQWELALDEGGISLSNSDLNNPFGTRAGHVYAWKQLQYLALVHGVMA